jgi:hypothetical protein
MMVYKAAAVEVGGCNFCPSRDGVYVVISDAPHSTLSVRFCDDCLRGTLRSARGVGFRSGKAGES